MTEDEAQIRALLEATVAGFREKDAKKIVAGNAPEMVSFSLAPPLVTRSGQASDIGGGRLVDMATAEGVQEWLDGFGDAPFDYEIRDLEVVAGGDVAFAYGLARMGSAGQFSLWFRMTAGLRKAGGAWQVTHTHESVPFYMDGTLKAAADLQP
jgi:ketosteroid isomerase-like protein